jgi:shikimate dehydrogenase
VALAELGVPDIAIVARNADKAASLVDLAGRLGMAARWVALGESLNSLGVVVNTLPAAVAGEFAGTVAGAAVLLDAIYDPWPTPLAAAVAAAGGRVVSGLQMLLNQAYAQVEQFTGMPAPREVMAAALAAS